MLHMLIGVLYVRVNGTYNDMEGLIWYVTHVTWDIICNVNGKKRYGLWNHT